jgi:bifunctional NMN adenylyltransferase/nudix hydrolase
MAETTAVLIGRFQPYHFGHKHIVDQALDDFDYLVILLGSANQPRSRRNPWTWTERASMIINCHPWDEWRIFIAPLDDNPNDEHWAAWAAGTASNKAPPGSEITIVGTRRGSEDYLEWFPQFKQKIYDTGNFRSGTEIRNDFLSIPGSFEAKVEHDVPTPTLIAMQQVLRGDQIEQLRRERP